jgi:hypothetical protein
MEFPLKHGYTQYTYTDSYGFIGCRRDDEVPPILLSSFLLTTRASLLSPDIPGTIKEYLANLLIASGFFKKGSTPEHADALMRASIFGENHRLMPGLIMCSSIFSPPKVPDILINVGNIQQVIPGTESTIDAWIRKYLTPMLNMLLNHFRFNLPHHAIPIETWKAWPGYNLFLDATPGTLLSRKVSLSLLLELWSQTPIFTRIGEEAYTDYLTKIKGIIIELIKIRLRTLIQPGQPDIYIEMIDFVTIAVYNIAGYLKSEFRNLEFATVAAIPNNIESFQHQANLYFAKDVRPQDHNIRIYYYIRVGRFAYAGDNILPGLPCSNPYAECFRGVGQYMRYIVWAQERFTIEGMNFHPCSYMIHRDAHASTPSAQSTSLDRQIFGEGHVIPAGRIIIAGTSLQQYTREQHVVLDPDYDPYHPDNPTMEDGNLDNILSFKMGVLAGLFTSKNPDALNQHGSCRFIGYPWLRQPFIDNLDGDGIPVTVPENSPTPRYWGYGLDEHILGYLFRHRIENGEAVDEIRVLVMNMAWLAHFFCPVDQGENHDYYKKYWYRVNGHMYDLSRKNLLNIARPDFYSYILDTDRNDNNIFGSQIAFETHFGNVSSDHYRVERISNYGYLDGPDRLIGIPNARQYRFSREFTKKFNCEVKSFNRYDRFDHYNYPPIRFTDDNQEYYYLTHSDNLYRHNLLYSMTVADQLSSEARQGKPGTDTDSGSNTCYDSPEFQDGGGSRKRFTRKRKRYLKNHKRTTRKLT